MNDLWRRCLARLEAEFSAEDVHTYLAPLQARESDAGLTLWAPNAYTLEIVRERYLAHVKRVLDHLVGHAVAVNLQVGAANGEERANERPQRATKTTPTDCSSGSARSSRKRMASSASSDSSSAIGDSMCGGKSNGLNSGVVKNSESLLFATNLS